MIISEINEFKLYKSGDFYKVITPMGNVDLEGSKEVVIKELKRWKDEVDSNNATMLEVENLFIDTLTKKIREDFEVIIKASDIKVGTQLAESDGFTFEVTEIVKETEKSITVRLCSDFSSFRSHWKENGGVIKTFRKSTKLYGIQ